MSDNDLVLVTGASGFIAGHVIKQLQEQGYRVRGTIRSLKDEKKTAPLMKLIENPKFQLELCEANLLDENSWLNAVKDCTYVIHTASPVPHQVPDDENEVILPAVNGTLYVLRACVAPESKVKRVVLTSSVSAIFADIFKDGSHFSEKDWPELANCMPYSKSKVLAEKAAWNFVKERKAGNQSCFELAVINPCLVMGPLVNDSDTVTIEVIKKLLERQIPLLADLYYCACDVRDVALAHIRAMTIQEAADNRHIIATTEEASSFFYFAKILNDEFASQGYNVPMRVAPNFLIKCFGLFDKTIGLVAPMLGKKFKCDNRRMLNVLQIEPIEVKKTIIDMAYNLIQSGKIKK